MGNGALSFAFRRSWRAAYGIVIFGDRAPSQHFAHRAFDHVLQHIRETNDYPSINMLEFLKWAEAYISDLRQRCSAPATDDELAESELWSLATTDTE